MKRGFLLLTLLSLLLLNTIGVSAVNEPHYGERPADDAPIIEVKKWVSSDEIKLGQNITVHVNVTNWSSYTAFNLSISEPIFSNWSISDYQGYDEYVYTQLKGNGSIYYDYTLTLLYEGNYTIEPTIIDYVDENGTQYNARSSYIPIFVYVEEPELDLSDIWKNIMWLSGLFVLIPILVRILLKIKNK